nr:reverse transcriptase domain-containing protein [Tanacetum cinerariifolium]
MANVTPIIATVKNASVKEKMLEETDAVPKANILDFSEEHYEDILQIILDGARHDKRKEVQTRLDFGESPKKVRREKENSLNSKRESESPSPRGSASSTSYRGHWKSREKGASQQLKKTCPYPGLARMGREGLVQWATSRKYRWRDEETIEEFMERFKIETRHIKGALECMQIFGFMHGVNNPELKKRLNEYVPNTVEEMMTATTAFIWGETTAASKKKVYTPWKSHDQSKRHTSEQRSDFRNQPKNGQGSNKFTP